MKRVGIALLLLSTITVAAEDPVTLHRLYKPDQKDSYQMTMSEHLESVDADVEASWTESVTKADDVGNADVTIAYTTFHITANGTDVPAPAPSSLTMHFVAGGKPTTSISDETSVSHLLPDLFAAYAFDQPLEVGKELTVDAKNGSDPVKGTLTLASAEDNLATVRLKLAFSVAGEAEPLHLSGTAIFDIKTSKLQSIEGTFSSLPPKLAGHYNVQSADFKVKRLP
jgi:hypothetical protein